MKCTILHEGKGRMRVHVENVRMTLHRADVLEAYLNHHDAIIHAAVYERTGDVVITYTGQTFRCHRCTGGLQVRCGRV